MAAGAVAGLGVMAWSPPALACGMSGIGAGTVAVLVQALLMTFLMSLVALGSMRGAGRAFGGMQQHRPGRGLRVAQVAARVGFGVSAAAAVVSGGLLLALGLSS